LDNQIKTYEAELPRELMDKVINVLDNPLKFKVVRELTSKDIQEANGFERKDTQLYLGYYDVHLMHELHDYIIPILEKYVDAYDLNHGGDTKMYASEIKAQKTVAGGGYHRWHYEHSFSSTDDLSRVFAWIIYLNDVEEGGETEFLYQGIRQPAKRNTLVAFPAFYTHTHRGNPPLKEDKYILTGWVHYHRENI
jgi:hypothetical protein